MHENIDFYRPNTTEELAELLRKKNGRIVAGCTDVLPRMRRGQIPGDCLVDISNLKVLHFIREENGQVQIGALVTHADLVSSQLIQNAAPALAEAAASIGSPQTRNRGTLGGNLANASPAADTAPPLLVLNAGVMLDKDGKQRFVRLNDFFRGPGQTVMASGEYIDHVFFDRPSGNWGMAFLKLGKRSGMAISVVSAAAFLALGPDGTIQTVRIALGSAAPIPLRSRGAEEFLLGKTPHSASFQKAGQAALQDISPIDDVRASAEYRCHAAGIAVQRVLEMAWEQAVRRKA
jgi:CO/xanthine dehydrogenase FAD-binding subunit